MNSNASLKCIFCPHANISPEIFPVRELSLSLLPGERSDCWFSLLVKPVSNTHSASGSAELKFKEFEKKPFSCYCYWRPHRIKIIELYLIFAQMAKRFFLTLVYWLPIYSSFLSLSSSINPDVRVACELDALENEPLEWRMIFFLQFYFYQG